MKHSLSVIVLVLLAAGTVLSQKARLEVSKLVNIPFLHCVFHLDLWWMTFEFASKGNLFLLFYIIFKFFLYNR